MRGILSGLAVSVIAALMVGAAAPRKAPAEKTTAKPTAPVTAAKLPASKTPSLARATIPAQPKFPVAQVSETGYTSALVCGSCHSDIYRSWKNSMHAFSSSDPVFEVAFMQAIKEQPAARALCLGCHAPVTLRNGDIELAEGVTREGVTCDFCHTVTGVDFAKGHFPYDQKLGRVKRSTMVRANSPAHDVEYSPLHSKAEFCGGCHHFQSDNGTLVMGTYNEWQAGPYSREGVVCQDCHMTVSGGRVVAKDVKSASGPINLHDLIHNAEQLGKAVKVHVTRTDRVETDLAVGVDIANVGSGHMIPTGVPNREVVLRVTARTADGRVQEQEKIYRKVLGGANREPIESDYQAFLYAACVLSDNRIAPRETRHETFHFTVQPGEPVNISATALYQYAPPLIKSTPMVITLAADSTAVQSGRGY